MLSILCVRLTIKVKVGIPESFKVGWYPPKKTGSSHLKERIVGREKSREGGKIVILSTSTAAQIPNHKTSQKNDISKQHSKHMSSY